jgi:DNA repair ATPase RecN
VSTDLQVLTDDVRAARRRLDARVGEMRMLAARGQELQQAAVVARSAREAADRVSGILSKIGSDRDAAARAMVESLVSAGLAAVFEERLTFHLVESMSRGIPQVDFVVKTHLPDGSEFETDVMSARGGGLAAVVGLLLRVVLILLTRGAGRNAPEILVLDETLAHLSSEYLEAAGQFLRTLVDTTGIQIVMVTHQETLTAFADVRYKFSLDATGATQVKKIDCCD